MKKNLDIKKIVIDRNSTPLQMVIQISYVLMCSGYWFVAYATFDKLAITKEEPTVCGLFENVLREEYKNHTLEQIKDEIYDIFALEYDEIFEIVFK